MGDRWGGCFARREEELVLAAGVGPGGLVVGIPAGDRGGLDCASLQCDTAVLQKDLPGAGHFIRKRGRYCERTRELVLALATWLSTVSALAALELSCVTRAEVPIALALELAVAVRPVLRFQTGTTSLARFHRTRSGPWRRRRSRKRVQSGGSSW